MKGFDSANWHATIDDDSSSVTFSLLSPDGDQGYPGNLNAFARYSLSPVSGELKVEYWGIPDKKTPINLSNHVYLNLAGHNKGWGLTIDDSCRSKPDRCLFADKCQNKITKKL